MNSVTKSIISTKKASGARLEAMPQILLGMMFMGFINGMLSYFHIVSLTFLTLLILMGISCIPCILYNKVRNEGNPFLIGFVIQNFTAAFALLFLEVPTFSAAQQIKAGLFFFMSVCILHVANLFTKRAN